MAEQIAFEIDINALSFKELNDLLKKNKKALQENFQVGSEGYDEQQKKVAVLIAEKRKLQKALQEQSKNYMNLEKSAVGSLVAMREQLKKLRKSYDSLSKAERESAKGEDLQKKIKNLNDELLKVEGSTGRFQRNVGNYSSAFDGMKGALSGAGGAAGAFFGAFAGASIIQGTIQIVAELGRAVVELAKEFNEVRKKAVQLSGQTGSTLAEITSDTVAISRTFGKESEEVLQAANAASKEFGISFREALTIVEEGLLSGADSNGEYIDSLKEYSTQAARAGLTAKEFNQILQFSAAQGIYSDKGIDAVKEFNLRVTDGSKATTEALQKAFGKKFTKDLLDNVKKGAISTSDALKKVSKALDDGLKQNKINAQQAQKVYADVFGGAGEDAGERFIRVFHRASKVTSNLTAEQERLKKQQAEQLQIMKDLTTEQEELTRELQPLLKDFDILTKKIEIFVTKMAGEFLEGMKSGIDLIGSFKDAITEALNENETLFQKGLSGVVGFFKTYFEGYKNVIQGVIDYNSLVIGGVTDLLRGDEIGSEQKRQQAREKQLQFEKNQKENVEFIRKQTNEYLNNVIKFSSVLKKDGANMQKAAELAQKNAAAINKEIAAELEKNRQKAFNSFQPFNYAEELNKTTFEVIKRYKLEDQLIKKTDKLKKEVTKAEKDKAKKEAERKKREAKKIEDQIKKRAEKQQQQIKDLEGVDAIPLFKQALNPFDVAVEKQQKIFELEKEIQKLQTNGASISEIEKLVARRSDLEKIMNDNIALLNQEQKEFIELQDINRNFSPALAADVKPLLAEYEKIKIELQKAKEARDNLTASSGLNEVKATEQQLAKVQGQFTNILGQFKNLPPAEVPLNVQFDIFKEEGGIETLKQMATEQIQAGVDTAFEIAMSNNERLKEARLTSIDEVYNKEVNAARGNAFLIEQAEKKKLANIAAAERIAAKKARSLAVKQAIINGALGVTKVFAVGSVNPFLRAAQIAQVVIQTAAQVASIQSQKFARGGLVEGSSASGGGMVQGRGHLFGGVNIEAKGGEAVINPVASRMFRNELSYMNSTFGGGRKFARGGVVGSSPNMARIAQLTSSGGIDTQKLIEGISGAINSVQTVLPLDTLSEENEKRTNFNNLNLA